ncbi:hypothetical protein GCM10010259_62930 [Streptomyces daghestanicus]|uniref:Uncharacterized protein n=1 Tax=Streptomyces daghestanicus TaxID=66885 RepID=A0ABQ3PYA0_9ACTN|nr:hypothetical protein GCM10010240_63400 [Streptomyces griseoviridis]GGU63857.1 hypothetical protein GCM10010259_62930 [Streptomyces daghestanicus]GHI30010.1 hypothetical protein Sdagh_17400 [Streptomyces daghestanicus]
MPESHRKRTWTRRRVLGAAAGGAAAAVGAFGGARAATPPDGTAAARSASPAGDVVGKVTVGYQGWFAAEGAGAPVDGWWHWARDRGTAPSPSNTGVKCWPDTREYTHTYPTDYAALGDGRPAALFSSYDQQTVDTHFAWMSRYGVDTTALQRFDPTGGEGPTRDAMTEKVRVAAEAHGVDREGTRRRRGARRQVSHHVRRDRVDLDAVRDQGGPDGQDAGVHSESGLRPAERRARRRRLGFRLR